jgi:hypothetical protein
MMYTFAPALHSSFSHLALEWQSSPEPNSQGRLRHQTYGTAAVPADNSCRKLHRLSLCPEGDWRQVLALKRRCRPAAAAAAFWVLRSLPVVRHSRKVAKPHYVKSRLLLHVDAPAGRAGSSPSSANTARCSVPKAGPENTSRRAHRPPAIRAARMRAPAYGGCAGSPPCGHAATRRWSTRPSSPDRVRSGPSQVSAVNTKPVANFHAMKRGTSANARSRCSG